MASFRSAVLPGSEQAMSNQPDDGDDYVAPETREYTFQPLAGSGRAPVVSHGADLSDALANLGRLNGYVIEGLNLNGLELDGLKIYHQIVRHCSFDGASLRDFVTSGALLHDVSFIGADLSSTPGPAHLRSNFFNTQFLWVRARHAKFVNAEIGNCRFKASQFLDCDFTGCRLTRTDILSDMEWDENDFAGSSFDDTVFESTIVAYAKMQNTSWRYARVCQAGSSDPPSVMRWVDMRGSVFHDTRFNLGKDTSAIDLRGTDASTLRLHRAISCWPSDAILETDGETTLPGGWRGPLLRHFGGRADLRLPWPSDGYNKAAMARLTEVWLSRKPDV
jgi:uncharacterized protein YjbI with pentapeptide repeats